MSYASQKVEERKRLTASIQALYDLAEKRGSDLTEDERRQLGEMENRTKVLDADIEHFNNLALAGDKARKLGIDVSEREESAERRNAENPPEKRGNIEVVESRARYDFGKKFVESDAFTKYEGRGSSGRVELPGIASPEARAAITTADFDQFVTGIWSGPAGPTLRTPLLDLLGRVQVSTASTTYLYWGIDVPEAPVVDEGELKPEAALTPEEIAIALVTYAHYKAITRQALEDVPQIQSIVQNKLLGGVRKALQNAAGAAISAATGIPTVQGADLLAAIRGGIARVEAAGFTPNGIGVNPDDSAALDLLAMANTVNGAVRSGSAWGLPVVSSNAIAVGSPIVGDFREGVTWFDRGTTDVFVTDSHSDFFLRNQLVILAEARAAFAVTEPAALAKASVAEPETPPESGDGGTGTETTPGA